MAQKTKKVELLAAMTLAEEGLWDREKHPDPPTFAPGDVVDIDPNLAQTLVGAGRAKYVGKDAEAEAPVTTADVAPAEDASASAPTRRTTAKG
jgi:hypothetical protein